MSTTSPSVQSIFATIKHPVQDFANCLDQARECGEPISNLAGLPTSFSAVHNNLPLIQSAAVSIQKHINAQNREELATQDLLLVKEVATLGYEQARLIRKQFTAVTSEGQDIQKNLAQYHSVVCNECQGVAIERAMQTLLQITKSLSATPFVGHDFGAHIDHAAKQVRNSESSVLEDLSPGKGDAFYNTGHGIQSIHTGRGNQNNYHGSGSIVNTGDSATISFSGGPEATERPDRQSLRKGFT